MEKTERFIPTIFEVFFRKHDKLEFDGKKFTEAKISMSQMSCQTLRFLLFRGSTMMLSDPIYACHPGFKTSWTITR